MEQGYQEMTAMIPENADDYEKVKTVYTYLIDTTEYVSSDHDQNLAGVFWKSRQCAPGMQDQSSISGETGDPLHLCGGKHKGQHGGTCMEYCAA